MTGKILIVDDDPYILKLLQVLLQREGFDVLASDSGENAVALTWQHKPDLILMDVMMPDLSGFEVARIIREDHEGSLIPIIFLSAKQTVADKRSGFDVGADDYIAKPFDQQELVARVCSQFRKLYKVRQEREKARTETLSQLMVTMAHYINNSLAVIRGSMALTRLDDPEEMKEFIERVDRQTRKIGKVVDSLREMAEEGHIVCTDYVGLENAMLDITNIVEKNLNEVDEDSDRQDAADYSEGSVA